MYMYSGMGFIIVPMCEMLVWKRRGGCVSVLLRLCASSITASMPWSLSQQCIHVHVIYGLYMHGSMVFVEM